MGMQEWETPSRKYGHVGTWKRIKGMCGSNPQILGNVIEDVGVSNRGDPFTNTKKIKLKYMKTKT